MNDYTELVKRLRVITEHIDNGVQIANGATVLRAADAIEEQDAVLQELTDYCERYTVPLPIPMLRRILNGEFEK